MADSPAKLIAQAQQLESRLRDQQARLVARQEQLDATLRKQVAAMRRREERRRELMEQERKNQLLEAHRAASVPRRLWQALGPIPLVLLTISFLDVSDLTVGVLGAAAAVVQIGAFLADQAAEHDHEEI